METQNPHKNNKGRLSKYQREVSFQHMTFLLANLPIEDQDKINYINQFIDKSLLPGLAEEDEITIGPMDSQMLHYFLYCVVLGFETSSSNE